MKYCEIRQIREEMGVESSKRSDLTLKLIGRSLHLSRREGFDSFINLSGYEGYTSLSQRPFLFGAIRIVQRTQFQPLPPSLYC